MSELGGARTAAAGRARGSRQDARRSGQPIARGGAERMRHCGPGRAAGRPGRRCGALGRDRQGRARHAPGVGRGASAGHVAEPTGRRPAAAGREDRQAAATPTAPRCTRTRPDIEPRTRTTTSRGGRRLGLALTPCSGLLLSQPPIYFSASMRYMSRAWADVEECRRMAR